MVSARAADQISYTSAPDRVVVSLNDAAHARDEVALPGGVCPVVAAVVGVDQPAGVTIVPASFR